MDIRAQRRMFFISEQALYINCKLGRYSTASSEMPFRPGYGLSSHVVIADSTLLRSSHQLESASLHPGAGGEPGKALTVTQAEKEKREGYNNTVPRGF